MSRRSDGSSHTPDWGRMVRASSPPGVPHLSPPCPPPGLPPVPHQSPHPGGHGPRSAGGSQQRGESDGAPGSRPRLHSGGPGPPPTPSSTGRAASQRMRTDRPAWLTKATSHRDRLARVEDPVEQWEMRVTELWERLDSLSEGEGISAMRELAGACPATDGRAAFELAGMYDSMGFESRAATEYEHALALGLDEARHAQLAVQYGSTLRNLGRFDEAIAVLRAAPTHESTGSAPRVVLALALHSAGRTDEALQVALETLIDALPRYQRSMRSYAAALTDPPPSDDLTTR